MLQRQQFERIPEVLQFIKCLDNGFYDTADSIRYASDGYVDVMSANLECIQGGFDYFHFVLERDVLGVCENTRVKWS